MAHPFPEHAPTPAEHFRFCFYGAVLHLLGRMSESAGSMDAAIERFPFLAGYRAEVRWPGLDDRDGRQASRLWQDALAEWEQTQAGHLPLRALGDAAGLDRSSLTLLLAIGLVEEDARFGHLFEALQGSVGQHRPTAGLLSTWWEPEDPESVRCALRRLQSLGLARAVNPETPRAEWALEPPGPIWDAIRGDTSPEPEPWVAYTPPDGLTSRAQLIVPSGMEDAVDGLPGLMESGEVEAVIVRGPRHNGRRTLLGAIARGLGRGLLAISRPAKQDDSRWSMIGPLATLLHGFPVIVLDLGPSESAQIPGLTAYEGPLGLVLGRQGGVSGAGLERAVTLTLPVPDAAARRRHWVAALPGQNVRESDEIAARVRMTGGHIRRAAKLARACAALRGRPGVTLADVQEASRALNRQALDTLATRLPAVGDWSHLAVSPETRRDLAELESRCRHRERLQDSVGPVLARQLNPGVRALLTGPSGAGKTLAARLLAAALEMDLYRLDLSTVVNKYIGETEKNLSEVFARAEELDVILLLDEGDALLTRRTSVQTSNDRYANLETNYLLQRLETFEGILLVTTNAADRIDSAFQRRMDVVVEFGPPDLAARWAIWRLHLPARHAIPRTMLDDVADRCTLNGGQIRNAVLHASLLAMADGGLVTAEQLEAAVRREYRKSGGVCPLRSMAPQLTKQAHLPVSERE